MRNQKLHRTESPEDEILQIIGHFRSKTAENHAILYKPSNFQAEDCEPSDIYETPYASVTVSEEPNTTKGESNQPRTLNPTEIETMGDKPHSQKNDYTHLQQREWIRQESRSYSSFGSNIAGQTGVALASFQGSVCPTQYASLLHAFERFDLGYHYSQMPLYTSAQQTHSPIGMQGSRDEPAAATDVMEWVVKKRPDGTRYITRRPIRWVLDGLKFRSGNRPCITKSFSFKASDKVRWNNFRRSYRCKSQKLLVLKNLIVRRQSVGGSRSCGFSEQAIAGGQGVT